MQPEHPRDDIHEPVENEAIQCPGCGGITDDPAGGPCSLCWERTDEAERLARERDVAEYERLHRA